MPVLGITGGIATGKSSLSCSLQPLIGAKFFDADKCARELLADDADVLRSVREKFGDQVFAANGGLDRAKIREIVFNDETQRRSLEAILHPIIRERWLKLARKSATETQWLIVDIPLLFETKAELYFDAIVVVACSTGNQRERIVKSRKLSEEMAAKMIASQLPLNSKIQRAHHMIWNDSFPIYLHRQAEMLASLLKKRYG